MDAECDVLCYPIVMHCIPSEFQQLGYAQAIVDGEWDGVDRLMRQHYSTRKPASLAEVLHDLRNHGYMVHYVY